MGGENRPDGVSAVSFPGSSPRGRGKLALAGRCARGWGSSPRGRGKRHTFGHCRDTGGLIPAWAGKTTQVSAPDSLSEAHPRVGGENENAPKLVDVSQGSSPRGRGKRDTIWQGISTVGLIPAWAGKTITRRSKRRPSPAHPRVGGENACSLITRLSRSWLIPAWAGKTSSRSVHSSSSGAHPRVGGENNGGLNLTGWDPGSSPRGRGKRVTHGVEVVADGLIPAWAGKTSAVTCNRCP